VTEVVAEVVAEVAKVREEAVVVLEVLAVADVTAVVIVVGMVLGRPALGYESLAHPSPQRTSVRPLARRLDPPQRSETRSTGETATEGEAGDASASHVTAFT